MNQEFLRPRLVGRRLEALAQRQDGWLHGKGRARDRAALTCLAQTFDEGFSPNLPLPHLYPTPEGGVQAVSAEECAAHELPVIEDGNPHPEHCSIDFQLMSANEVKRKGALLRAQAETHGWLFKEVVA